MHLLRKKSTRYYPKFEFRITEFDLIITRFPNNFVEINEYVENIFDEVIKEVAQNSDDFIYFIINHSDLTYPIEIPLSRASEITGADILTLFQKIITSNQKVKWDKKINITVGLKKMNIGGGGGKLKYKKFSNIVDFIVNNKNVINLQNKDNLCLFRSIAILIADIEEKPYRIDIRRNWSKIQREHAETLARSIDYDFNKKASLFDVQAIEKKINYQIHIIDCNQNDFKFIYVGANTPRASSSSSLSSSNGKQKIFLLLFREHFYPITSMPGFYNHRSFCTKCLKPYNCSFANHICNYDEVFANKNAVASIQILTTTNHNLNVTIVHKFVKTKSVSLYIKTKYVTFKNNVKIASNIKHIIMSAVVKDGVLIVNAQ